MALLELIGLAKKLLDIFKELKDSGTLDAVVALAKRVIDVFQALKASGKLDDLHDVIVAITVELQKAEIQAALATLQENGLL